MLETTLIVFDQCNVKFKGLDSDVRHQLSESLKFIVPNARHMPAYKLGRWDGTVSFCTAGGSTFLNLLDRVLPIITSAGYNITIEDHRPVHHFAFPEVTENLFADRCWPVGHTMAGEPILLRDYQVEAIRGFIDNPQGLQQLPTGSGKTILIAALSALVEPFGRSVVIVPSKNLVTQTEEDYRNLALDVGVFFGDRKEWGHQHTICTWQSLSNLAKQPAINSFIKDIICVIIDESHAVRGKILKDLLTGPLSDAPIRWGLTGTIPKEEHEAMCLLAAIGPTVGHLRAAELQEKGVLARCQVEVVQFQDDHVGFVDYDSEHDYLVTDQTRLRRIAGLVEQWTDSGNTLVLVDRIEAGETLHKLLPGSAFICGSTKIAKRQEEYKSIQTAEQKIIIATYGVAAVGINIPRIFNLVLLEPGKSFIRVIQSIGRGLRRAKDKDYIRIIDLCSSLKFSKRHLTKRKSFYVEQDYPHRTMKEKL